MGLAYLPIHLLIFMVNDGKYTGPMDPKGTSWVESSFTFWVAMVLKGEEVLQKTHLGVVFLKH